MHLIPLVSGLLPSMGGTQMEFQVPGLGLNHIQTLSQSVGMNKLLKRNVRLLKILKDELLKHYAGDQGSDTPSPSSNSAPVRTISVLYHKEFLFILLRSYFTLS